MGKLLTLGVLVFSVSACTPAVHVVQRDYEHNSITKQTELGWKVYPVLLEDEGEARARLLQEIHSTCPEARLLAEGTDSKNRVEWDMVLKQTDSVTDHFYWIRYRCGEEVTASQQ